jgi:hypothetical protein
MVTSADKVILLFGYRFIAAALAGVVEVHATKIPRFLSESTE